MIAPTQLKKPSNWQDFEKLCKLLWGEVWECPDTIKRNGRQGQTQNGVDVYAYVEKEQGYCGIQCKGKDNYTNAQLTEKEIDREIAKAKNFKPSLKRFIFATTAIKDVKIEEYIRIKNLESLNIGGFRIDIFSWEDIVDLLEQYRQTYNWYVNNCQFKDNTDVSVTFDGKEVSEIHPEYIKNITRYKLKKSRTTDILVSSGDILQEYLKNNKAIVHIPYIDQSAYGFQRKYKHDYRWCNINIQLENTGCTVIRSPKLILYFNPDLIEEIDDKFRYNNAFGIDESVKAQINIKREQDQEVFEIGDSIEYRPKETTIVQSDKRYFSFKVKAKDGIDAFPIMWEFLCEDYKKHGFLTVNVIPNFIEKVKTEEVEDASLLKDDDIDIIPKIIEE